MARVRFTNVSTIQIVDDGVPELGEEVIEDPSRNIQVNRVVWNQIIILECSNNQLETLPTLPQTLTTLSCYNNKLKTLHTLPQTLTTLWCSRNKLTTLPTLPQTLINLDCDDNQLEQLPILPQLLTNLHCSKNQLKELPILPLTLTYLDCAKNQLQILPTVPLTLTDLECSNNQLQILPTLPLTLTYLQCGGNQLKTLPTLPQTLKTLWCSNNKLTILPTVPLTLTDLYCGNNPLTSMPNLLHLSSLEISVYQLMLIKYRREDAVSSVLRSNIENNIAHNKRARLTVVDEDSYERLMHDDNLLKKYTSIVSLLIDQMKNRFNLECPNLKLLVEKIKKMDTTSPRGLNGISHISLHDNVLGNIKGFGGTRKRYSKNSRKRYSKNSRKLYSKKSRA